MTRAGRSPGQLELDPHGRYELGAVLGRGGMGTVYAAFDRERGEPVALKTIDRLDPNGIARLKHEFRVLTGISHPNVVTFLELHSHGGRWFFTMERVDGVSLLEWVRPLDPSAERVAGTRTVRDTQTASPTGSGDTFDTPSALAPVRIGKEAVEPAPALFDEPRLRDAMRQLCRGLFAIHRAGRVHRDVKPSNVQVTPEGRLVILDFGIAAAVGRGAETAGTVAYMAPEQLGDAPVGPSADLFATGVLLYQALTGELPFTGTAPRVLMAKLQEPRVPPGARVSPVPEDLDALCLELLHAEPSERPDARDVLSRLSERRRERQSDGASGTPTELVGRDATLEGLTDAWTDAFAGTGSPALVLSGPVGIGKTRILDEAAQRLAAKGVRVLRARCDAREAIPYRGLDQIVDAMARAEQRARARGAPPRIGADGVWLAYLFPSVWSLLGSPNAPGGVADPTEQRRRAFDELSRWLARIAAERPVAILVDDADELDADGRALLGSLFEGAEGRRRLFFLLTAPSDDAFAGLRALPIPPLTEADGTRLARTLVPARTRDGLLVGLVRLAQSRPGWIVELAADLWGGQSSSGSTAGSRHVVLERLTDLDPGALELLELCAIAHAPLDLHLAAVACEVERSEAASRVETLRGAHLAQLEPGAAEHTLRPPALVAKVISETISSERAAALHRRLAHVFARERPRAGPATARHLLAAGDHRGAAAQLRASIEEAREALAFDRVAELCELAARAEPEWALAHLRARGHALAAAGRGAEAAEAFDQAAARATDRHVAIDLRREAADQLIRAGHLDRGRAVLAEVLASVGVTMPRSALGALPVLLARRAQLLLRGYGFTERAATEIPPQTLLRVDTCWTACGLLNVDIYLGAYFQTLYLLHALDAGEPRRVARALAFESPLLAAAGRRGRAEQMTARARELAHRIGDPHAEGLADGTAGLALVQQGRWREANEDLERAEATLRDRCIGAFWELVTVQVTKSWCLSYLGRLRDLRRALHGARAAAAVRGDVFGVTNLAVGATTWAWLVTDEPTRARRVIEESIAPWSSEGFHVQHFFELVSHALIDLYEERASAGLARLDAAWPRVRRSQLLRNQLLRIVWNDLRARLCLAAAQRSTHANVLWGRAAKDAQRIAKENMLWSNPLAALIRAGLASQRETARAELERAAAGFDAADMAMHAAVARSRLAALGGGGERLEASAWARAERPASPNRIEAVLAPML